MSNTTITLNPTVLSPSNNHNMAASVLGTGFSFTSTHIPYTIGTTNSSVWPQTTSIVHPNGTVELKGDNADLIVNGKSILETISNLEQRLGWLVCNPTIEKDWNELKQLGDKYRQVELEIKEKIRLWEILNKPQC